MAPAALPAAGLSQARSGAGQRIARTGAADGPDQGFDFKRRGSQRPTSTCRRCATCGVGPWNRRCRTSIARRGAARTQRDPLRQLHPTSANLCFAQDDIALWPDSIDPNGYPGEIDVLITDYSSVLYDHIYSHDRGVILYVFDYEDYQARERDLLYPFEENVAGVRAETSEQISARRCRPGRPCRHRRRCRPCRTNSGAVLRGCRRRGSWST